MSTYKNVLIIVEYCSNQESMANRFTVMLLENIGLSMTEIGAHLKLLLFLFTENAFSLPFSHSVLPNGTSKAKHVFTFYMENLGV